MNEDFYNTEEWRILRYAVLRNGDGRCVLCGRSSKDGIKLHVDHIVPISRNKKFSKRISNLQVLCEDCNTGKSNTDSIDWARNQKPISDSKKKKFIHKTSVILRKFRGGPKLPKAHEGVQC